MSYVLQIGPLSTTAAYPGLNPIVLAPAATPRGALLTDGTGSFAQFPQQSIMDTGNGFFGGIVSGTWSFWIQLSGNAFPAAEAEIWEKGSTGSGSWAISTTPGGSGGMFGTNRLRFSIPAGYQTQWDVSGSGSSSRWNHFAITWLESTNPIGYQNGNIMSVASHGNALASAYLPTSSSPTRFGGDQGGAGGPSVNFGAFYQDQNALFTSSMTQNQVQTILYNNGCPQDLSHQPNIVFYQQWGVSLTSSVGNFVVALTGALSSSTNHGAIATVNTTQSPLC